jgi:hypothetical protein
MLRAFLWPNYLDRDRLAREFFRKAKQGVDSLNLPYHISISLCSKDGQSFVLALVQCPESNSDNMNEALKDYLLVKCGCPKWQTMEVPYLGRDITVDNITQRTAQHGIAILDDIVVQLKNTGSASTLKEPVHDREVKDEHFEGGNQQGGTTTSAAGKKWWQFWK